MNKCLITTLMKQLWSYVVKAGFHLLFDYWSKLKFWFLHTESFFFLYIFVIKNLYSYCMLSLMLVFMDRLHSFWDVNSYWILFVTVQGKWSGIEFYFLNMVLVLSLTFVLEIFLDFLIITVHPYLFSSDSWGLA